MTVATWCVVVVRFRVHSYMVTTSCHVHIPVRWQCGSRGRSVCGVHGVVQSVCRVPIARVAHPAHRKRLSAEQALKHKWLEVSTQASLQDHNVSTFCSNLCTFIHAY